MEIRYTNEALKGLKKINKKDKKAVSIIKKEILNIKENNKEGKGSIQGFSIHRFNIKNIKYRIIYDIVNNVNHIFMIGTRDDFYD